jgi:3'(2'), 5'-bisphosphate nucleotidase
MELLEIIKNAAKLAGEKILEIYESDNFEQEIKSDNSPLTKADREAHLIIKKELEKTGLPILSEEGKQIDFSERKNWGKFWMVDPLDGTKEFIKRNGEFTVNIALIENGIPTLGVVYCPVKGWLYYSDRNLSFKDNKDGTTVQLPQIEKRNNLIIVGSRSHSTPETETYVQNLKVQTGKDVEFISMGSSLKLCLVAEGKADVYPRLAPTMEWDTAAAHAVAKTAGCEVIQYESGQPVTYNKENLLNPYFVVQRL